jgi:hypothetical protein
MSNIGLLMLATALVLALAGCATDPQLAKDQAAFSRVKLSGGTADIARKEGKVELLDDQRVRCERYFPTGSHRAQVRCLTVAEKVTADEANAREMRKLTTPPPAAHGTLSK